MPERRSHVGPGAFDRLPELLGDARRVALVCGERSFALSGAEARLAALLPRGVQLRRFSDFQRNPTAHDVARGIAWLSEEPSDLLLAVGGGSVMDVAKAINVLATLEVTPRHALLQGVVPTGRALPLVAVPTTAGTGAEVTRFAALYIDGIKHSLDHPCLTPTAALVDPTLARSMPARLAACTGLDALCQAIESYWAVRATATSRQYAGRAIAAILPHLTRAVCDGAEDAYTHLSEGAWYAGRAIDISRTTAAHALSYPLTVRAGIPHGHAVALTLPYFMRVNAGAMGPRECRAGVAMEALDSTLGELWDLLGCHDAEQAAAQLEGLLHALDLEREVAAADACLLQRMVGEINPQRLGNNPVVIDEQAVVAAYEALLPRAGG